MDSQATQGTACHRNGGFDACDTIQLVRPDIGDECNELRCPVSPTASAIGTFCRPASVTKPDRSERPDGVHWDGMEYWDHAGGQGVIFAFHGSDAAEPKHRFVLSGLDARTIYHLHFEDGTSPDATASGRQLMTSGLQVVLREPLSSEPVFLLQP